MTDPVKISPELDAIFRDTARKLNNLTEFLPEEVFDVHLGELINPVYNPKRNGTDITFFTKYLTCHHAFDPKCNYHEGWGSDDTEDFRIRVAHRIITIDNKHFIGGQTSYNTDLIEGVSYITNFHEGEKLYGKKSWENHGRQFWPQQRIVQGKMYLFQREIRDLRQRNGHGDIYPLTFFCCVLSIINPEIFPFNLYHEYTIETNNEWTESLDYPKHIVVAHEQRVTLGPVPIYDVSDQDHVREYQHGLDIYDVDLDKEKQVLEKILIDD